MWAININIYWDNRFKKISHQYASDKMEENYKFLDQETIDSQCY